MGRRLDSMGKSGSERKGNCGDPIPCKGAAEAVEGTINAFARGFLGSTQGGADLREGLGAEKAEDNGVAVVAAKSGEGFIEVTENGRRVL
jgi:hypothetical protein